MEEVFFLVEESLEGGYIAKGVGISIFTIPQFRDKKLGRFLLNTKRGYLMEKGIQELHYNHVGHKIHAKYLQTIGFSEKGGEYFRKIS